MSGRLRRVAVLTAAGLLVAAASACVDPEPSSPTPQDIADIDVSPDHTISVDADGFDPVHLEIEPGEVVLLVNEGDEQHSFTADERFDTGRMEPGEDTTLVLTEPGEITYRDLEVPEHEGTLTIVDTGER